MEHTLKCWPEHYAAIDSGAKTCELRLNDRPYQRGDALLLKEWEPVENAYTGRELRVRVTHVLSGGPWLAPGYVALSIRLMGEDGRARIQEDFRLSYDKERARADALARERDEAREILDATENETLVQAARWLAQEEESSLFALQAIHTRYWKQSIPTIVALTNERDELLQLARDLDASIHGDGNGRCWCGAKEADALRAVLEKRT